MLGIAKERGALAGQHADIVARPDSPLENLQALRVVHFVMKNGTIVRRPHCAELKDDFRMHELLPR